MTPGTPSASPRARSAKRAIAPSSRRPASPCATELVRHGPHDRTVAQGLATELLALPEPPTAVFASSDVQATGVLAAAAAAGLRVPDDLSVIGFDDIELSAYVGLTTVRQPLFDSGYLGGRLLLDASGPANRPRPRPTARAPARADRALHATERTRTTGRPPMAEIVLEDVWKVYPDGTEAVRSLDLAIHDKEFMVLVGPSGCGKTTALRMVAGLEGISRGDGRASATASSTTSRRRSATSRWCSRTTRCTRT